MRENQKGYNVVLLSPIAPPPGGIASWTERLLKWSKVNADIFILVNTSLIGKRAGKNTNKRNLFEELKRSNAIFKDMNKKMTKQSIVHINTSLGKFGIIRDYLSLVKAKNKKGKVVMHFRCNIDDQITTKSKRKYLLKIIKLSDMNIVLNQSSYNYIKKYVSDEKINILPNFIEQKPLLTPRMFSKELKEVLYVGHLNENKGVPEIIEVAKRRPDLNFNLIGEPLIPLVDLPENIHILGVKKKEDLMRYYLECDVFLFPSHTEGFSNALLEAMSLGCPCITTPVGANAEMIEDQGGLLVKVGDVEEILAALKKINDKDIRQAMSMFNLHKVATTYTIDNVMNKLISIYDELESNH